MSVAMPSHRIGSEAFSLLVRLFNGLKRRGRVIDVIWFQQSPEYARAVLALADECDDESVRELGVSLRRILGEWLVPPVVVMVAPPVVSAAPAPVPVVETGAETSTETASDGEDIVAGETARYIGRLR